MLCGSGVLRVPAWGSCLRYRLHYLGSFAELEWLRQQRFTHNGERVKAIFQ